ncbi:hypothetical protein [Pararhodobacter sp.]
MAGTQMISVIAMLVAIRVGLRMAIWLTRYASPRPRGFVCGVFALVTEVPFLSGPGGAPGLWAMRNGSLAGHGKVRTHPHGDRACRGTRTRRRDPAGREPRRRRDDDRRPRRRNRTDPAIIGQRRGLTLPGSAAADNDARSKLPADLPDKRHQRSRRPHRLNGRVGFRPRPPRLRHGRLGRSGAAGAAPGGHRPLASDQRRTTNDSLWPAAPPDDRSGAKMQVRSGGKV